MAGHDSSSLWPGPAYYAATDIASRAKYRGIAAAFLVAAFFGAVGLPAFDSVNITFVSGPVNWSKIKHSAKSFFVYGSDNDPQAKRAGRQRILPMGHTIRPSARVRVTRNSCATQDMRASIAVCTGILLFTLTAPAANNVAVPESCTPQMNSRLAQLLKEGTRQNVDNVMVCGVTTKPSRSQRRGEHGGHELLSLRVQLPGIGTRLVQVAINEQLDGVITAPANAAVFAYGQAFFDKPSLYVAGIHDVHCSTHRGADNGWVVVNGKKSPGSCPK
jgi:hypothetical protein